MGVKIYRECQPGYLVGADTSNLMLSVLHILMCGEPVADERLFISAGDITDSQALILLNAGDPEILFLGLVSELRSMPVVDLAYRVICARLFCGLVGRCNG